MRKTILIITITAFIIIFIISIFAWRALRPALAPADIIINQAGEVEVKDNKGPELTPPEVPLSAPEGFNIKVFAGGLGKVRDIAQAPDGIIISSIQAGKVIYLPDKDFNDKADSEIVLLEGLNNPHGLLEYCPDNKECKFYVAETGQVSVYDYDKEKMALTNGAGIIDLPSDGGHYTRHLIIKEIGGEDKLLITVGSSCNVCEEKDWRRAKILVSNPDGSDLKEYARGLRNSVFMALNPFTSEIWATDMGRDWLGDELPPEEVNIIRDGADYGWPVCYGNKIHDTDFDKKTYIRNPCEDTTAPTITMPAHSAPLGLSFIPEEGWPEEYRYNLLVAQHGSWNRSTPIGYKVVRMKLDREGNYSGTEDFLTGFLTEGEAWGRPVDVLTLPDGKIFVSDDKAGAIYVLTYTRSK